MYILFIFCSNFHLLTYICQIASVVKLRLCTIKYEADSTCHYISSDVYASVLYDV